MSHSDVKGIVLPPKVAPVKVVIVPIYRKDVERSTVLEQVDKVAADLNSRGIVTQVDNREEQSPGAKFFHWERLGVPVTIELGPRDVAAGTLVVKRRDLGTKQPMPVGDAPAAVTAILEAMQKDLYTAALNRRKENTVIANSFEEVADILKDVTAEKGGGKFVMAHIKDDPACDDKVKELKASVRCVPLVDEFDGPGKCTVPGGTRAEADSYNGQGPSGEGARGLCNPKN